MRYLICLCLALTMFGSTAKADYQVPRDAATLLQDALNPASRNRNTALSYLRYHLEKDSEMLRQHLAELEAVYPTLPENSDPRSALAITLLGIGSQLDKTSLRLMALRESDNYGRSTNELSTTNLLRTLGTETPPEQATTVLTGLLQNELPTHWGGDYPALESFITTITSLLAQDTAESRPQHLTQLVRYRMKYAGYFDHYRTQEAQSPNFTTIFDHHDETEVTALLKRLDDAICTYPPQPEQKRWVYTFVPHTNMFETGPTTQLACGD